MSYHDYKFSLNMIAQDPPFYGLIMAAMRKADSTNIMKLRAMFPEIWAEFQLRYNCPEGCISVQEFKVYHNNNEKPEPALEKFLSERIEEERRKLRERAIKEEVPLPGDFVEDEFT